MAEQVDGKSVFSLFDVTRSIQKTLSERYSSLFWVKAEMNKLNFYKHSGHCYPELVEKREGKVVAQIKAVLWRDDYNRINHSFLQLLKEPLKDGIKILFLARITFDSAHGLSLSISDIDASYTLGDLQKEKADTIAQLKSAGIYDNNKRHQMPALPQRIAIISVETSKGLADFLKIVEGNEWNYRFFHCLFPSLLQGDHAASAIVRQLKRIEKVKEHFDVVAIIRGGGGDVGLACYNDYALANAIANFPIPVITGIGHATNETVAEMISFYNAITPSKLAEYLIQHFHNFSVPLQDADKKIVNASRILLHREEVRLQTLMHTFRYVTDHTIQLCLSDIKNLSGSLRQQVKYRIQKEEDCLTLAKRTIEKSSLSICYHAEKVLQQYVHHVKKDSKAILLRSSSAIAQHQQILAVHGRLMVKEKQIELKAVEKNIENMNPVNVLKRGYSITLWNGKALKSADSLKEGDLVETVLLEGRMNSIVQKVTMSDNENK